MTFANEQRAHRCAIVLTAYSRHNDLRENLIDLLADAMHWCKRTQHDFAAILDAASQHYAVEIAEAEDEGRMS